MDKTPLDCDLFDLIVLFIPVHLGQHWVSIEVHFLTCRIVYMDSFNNNGTDKMNCVFHFLNFMHQQRDGPDSGPLEKQNWSFEHDLVDPQQNASDCGVYQGIRAILSTDPFVQENRFPCVGRRFHFKHTDVSLTSMMHRVVFGWLN
jgi:Ulp1 family protease